MGEKVKIKGAWWVSGRARVSVPGPTLRYKQVGQILARGLDDKIYKHRVTDFMDPHGMVQQINQRAEIDMEFWTFKSDDSEAARYYENHFEPGEYH